MPDEIVEVVENPVTVEVVVGQVFGGGGGGGVSDGDKGDITVSDSGTDWRINDGAVTDDHIGSVGWSKLTGVPAFFDGTWDSLTGKPSTFPPSAHSHPISDVTGLQAALDDKQVALGFTPENAAQKGVAGGYAGLDGTGKVPAAQLPAYVDDVVEAANFAALPGTGETGKIYVTLDTNKTWRWSGSAYVEISASPGSTDSVTEGSTNLYFTAARVRATDLTGYSAAGSRVALAAGDTILGAFSKLGKWVADLGQAAFAVATSAGLAMLTAATAAAQTALLDVFTSGAKGLAPASGGGTTNFLRADGSWAAPGGGSPGGSSGEVQYNNAGAFAGAADVEIEGGQLRLPAISTPSAPAAGGVKLFGAASAEGARPAVESESGWPEWLQSAIAKSAVSYFQPVGTNVITMSFGCIVSAQSSDTTTAKTMATTNAYTRARGVESLKTGAAVNNCAGHRFNSAQWRTGGGGAGQGGFRSHMIFGPATGVTALHCAFCGLYSVVGNAPGDKEPSAVTDLFGFGYDSGDSNIQFLHNDGSGTATKIDLGASFPKPSADRTHVYDCEMYSPPGTTQMVAYRITNRATGAVASGVVTTNLPSNSTYLTPHIWARIAASAVIGIMDGGIYIETLGNA